jgi:multiple sugar transport system permease protein
MAESAYHSPGSAGRRRMALLGLHALLAVQVVVGLLPFWWMVRTSLSGHEMYSENPTFWTQMRVVDFTVKNFSTVLEQGRFGLWTVNSLVVAMLSTVLTVLVSALAGFAFAKMRFRYRDELFWLVLCTTMVPAQAVAVPRFGLFVHLGLYNSYQVLIVPGISSAIGIFLMCQFFKGIPQSLVEAARIDGASWMDIFWRIMLPLSKPALVVLGLMTFIGSWNDFVTPLMYTNTVEMRTLPVGLQRFAEQFGYAWDIGAMMAGAVMVMIPCLIIFALGQRQFTEGIATSGLKE